MWFICRIGGAATLILAGLLSSFALPIEEWRTGDQQLVPLTYEPTQSEPNASRRLWIDTDAACGYSRRTDPDDCFAIALLAQFSDVQVVGISTVFGNGPLEVVNRTTIDLASGLSAELRRPLPVYSGYPGPQTENSPPLKPPAHDALANALAQGPLTIIALGPLTNLAAVLRERPTLRTQITRVLAVMGRRPGHLFHPAEGAGSGILFGHGPVFRDFNFVMDMGAVSEIVALDVPITLIPYDAARGIEMTADDLDRLGESNRVVAWIATRARPWLGYWLQEIGRKGFSPFDLLAAAYVTDPYQFKCAPVRIWVGEDPTLFIPFWRSTALLVGQNAPSGNTMAVGSASYCAKISADLKDRLVDRFVSWSKEFDAVLSEKAVAPVPPDQEPHQRDRRVLVIGRAHSLQLPGRVQTSLPDVSEGN